MALSALPPIGSCMSQGLGGRRDRAHRRYPGRSKDSRSETAGSAGSGCFSLVGDNAVLGERVDQLVAVTTEQGFPLWRAQRTIYRGWLKVQKWRCDRRNVPPAQRFERLPRHRGVDADAPGAEQAQRPAAAAATAYRSRRGIVSQALSIAEAQEAKLWELRAPESLIRLRRDFTGPSRRSPRSPRPSLRLVHRRLRHTRP
jgi:hypothetical protein